MTTTANNVHQGINFNDTKRFVRNTFPLSTSRIIVFPRYNAIFDTGFYKPEMTDNRLEKHEIE